MPSPHPAPARPSDPGNPPDTHPATHCDRTGSSADRSAGPVTQPDRRRAPSRRFHSCHARCQQEHREPTPPTGMLTCVPRGNQGREAGGREGLPSPSQPTEAGTLKTPPVPQTGVPFPTGSARAFTQEPVPFVYNNPPEPDETGAPPATAALVPVPFTHSCQRPGPHSPRVHPAWQQGSHQLWSPPASGWDICYTTF